MIARSGQRSSRPQRSPGWSSQRWRCARQARRCPWRESSMAAMQARAPAVPRASGERACSGCECCFGVLLVLACSGARAGDLTVRACRQLCCSALDGCPHIMDPRPIQRPLLRLPQLSAKSEGTEEAEDTAGMMCPEVWERGLTCNKVHAVVARIVTTRHSTFVECLFLRTPGPAPTSQWG